MKDAFRTAIQATGHHPLCACCSAYKSPVGFQTQKALVEAYLRSGLLCVDFPQGPPSDEPITALAVKINAWAAAEFSRRTGLPLHVFANFRPVDPVAVAVVLVGGETEP